jgi:hypothetical protein
MKLELVYAKCCTSSCSKRVIVLQILVEYEMWLLQNLEEFPFLKN